MQSLVTQLEQTPIQLKILQHRLKHILNNKKTQREKRENTRKKNKRRRRTIIRPYKEFIDSSHTSRYETCFTVAETPNPDVFEKEHSPTKLPALKSKNEVGKYHQDFFRHAETQASRFLNRQVKGLNLEDFLTSILVQSKQAIQELHEHNNSQIQHSNKFSTEEIQGLTNQYTELSEQIKSAMNMETVQNKDKTNENSIGPKASIMTPQVSSTFKSPPHIINTSTTNATLTAEEYKILNQELKELIKYAKNSEMKKFE